MDIIDDASYDRLPKKLHYDNRFECFVRPRNGVTLTEIEACLSQENMEAVKADGAIIKALRNLIKYRMATCTREDYGNYYSRGSRYNRRANTSLQIRIQHLAPKLKRIMHQMTMKDIPSEKVVKGLQKIHYAILPALDYV